MNNSMSSNREDITIWENVHAQPEYILYSPPRNYRSLSKTTVLSRLKPPPPKIIDLSAIIWYQKTCNNSSTKRYPTFHIAHDKVTFNHNGPTPSYQDIKNEKNIINIKH